MTTRFAREVLKVAVAQICQNIGWHAVHSSPLEILIDILQEYLTDLARLAHLHANHYGRTETNLDDLGLSFKSKGVSLSELEEYINNVEPVPYAYKYPCFVVPNPSKLQFHKTTNKELLNRPEWVDKHLPPMHLEPDEEDQGTLSLNEHIDETIMTQSMEDDDNNKLVLSLLGSPKPEYKFSAEPAGEDTYTTNNTSKIQAEEEGRPMRELATVFMTSAGLIMPARDGHIPNSCLPSKEVESRPASPESWAEKSECSIFKQKAIKIKEIKKDKDKPVKSKKDISGILKKESKKIKLSKKDNKENSQTKSSKQLPGLKLHHQQTHIKKEGKEGGSAKFKKKTKPSIEGNKSPKGKSEKVKNKEDKPKIKTSSKPSKPKNKPPKVITSVTAVVSSPLSPPSVKSLKSVSGQKSPVSLSASKSEKSGLSSLPAPKSPHTAAIDVAVKNESVGGNQSNKFEFDQDSPPGSPDSRLVIDDSVEVQAQHEMESRLAVLDDCIDAVIQRAREETEKQTVKNYKAIDDTIEDVIRSSVKKSEPKDVYDFTDDSLDSSPPTPKTPDVLETSGFRFKKEKVKTEEPSKLISGPEEQKTKSKDKSKKKSVKDSKCKSLTPLSPLIKPQKPLPSKTPDNIKESSSNSIKTVKTELEGHSDNDCSPFSSITGFPSLPPAPQRYLPQHTFGCLPPPPPFIPSSAPYPSPNTASATFNSVIPSFFPLNSQMSPTSSFPTPPLFGSSTKLDCASSQPLNLAMSGPYATTKTPAEKKDITVTEISSPGPGTLSLKPDPHEPETPDKVKIDDIGEKPKVKEHKKEKKEKIDKKEKIKKRSKDKEKNKDKEKEKDKPKEKKEESESKAKPKEKVEKWKTEKKSKTKVEKEKEKKKSKDKEEKEKEDNAAIPKITFKLGGSGSKSKIVIKASGKSTSSRTPSPSPNSPVELPAIPPKIPTPPPPQPSPVIVASPPPPPPPPPTPPRIPTPLPPEPTTFLRDHSPSPTSPTPSMTEALNPLTLSGSGKKGGKFTRGRGRKRGSSHTSAPARTVITETIGIIQDDSGNMIWICPACTNPDDGRPMIGCDECDNWFHWVCVGIVVPPKDEEPWYCDRCITRKQEAVPKKKRKKKK
ncbi:TBP-associated factor 3 [Tachypleus tridentatus]|uniref:TBP-associated factor 3 n=1 Tax=Tachypleus tridentatus TaxID=6853 RepID=UPI003FD03516